MDNTQNTPTRMRNESFVTPPILSFKNNEEKFNYSSTISPCDYYPEKTYIPLFKGITKKPTRFYTKRIIYLIIRSC